MPRNRSHTFDEGRRQSRPQSSLGRRVGTREPRAIILIVCEGAETEPNCFKSLRKHYNLSTVEVEIEGNGCAPITVVRQALKRRDERKKEADATRQSTYSGPAKYDEVWCVFDVEFPPDNTSFSQAVDQARGNNLSLAVSNPSFEVWYLLHFVETNRPFANSSRVAAVLNQYVVGYRKNMDIFLKVNHRTDEAIERARKQLSLHPDQNRSFPNSSTTVYQLIAKLRSMASS